ncbi:MAG: SpoIID/LytB domain-containing protein [Magnetococcales bacterium]|nr:SpoIID/LytB domain-containing protein [Magnetococcales bacterium]
MKTDHKFVWFFVFISVFLITDLVQAAKSDEDFLNNPEVIAQWNLNVGSLALDESQYLDALAYFEDAYNTSKLEKTKVRALLHKATTFATFLHSTDSALNIYKNIRKKYPNSAQTAFYQEALLLFETEQHEKLVELEKEYSGSFKNGRFRFQTEFLREQSKKIIKTKSYQQKKALLQQSNLAEQAWLKQDRLSGEVIKKAKRELRRLKTLTKAQSDKAARLQNTNQLKDAQIMGDKAALTNKHANLLLQDIAAKEIARKLAKAKFRKSILKNVTSGFDKVAEPVIRVLLHKGTGSLVVMGDGVVLQGDGGVYRPQHKIRLKADSGRIVIDGGRGVTFGKELKITANRPISLVYDKGKKKVRGYVMLLAQKNRIRVINHVKMEAYLRSVVPAESWANWGLEALKAQAMAARTYGYDHIRTHSKKPFDVYATHRSQVYGGVEREVKKTDLAVSQTRGEVLTSVVNGKVRPILAMYAANSGGHTADPNKEYDPDWSRPPSYLVAQEDPWSIKAGKKGWASWEYTHSIREIEKNLEKRKIRLSNLTAITPLFIGPSGRVVTVKLQYDGGKSKTIRFRPKVTLGLGGRIKTLPDTIVRIKKVGSNFVFTGKGFGHGIGYMQHGGQAMAKAGHSYRDILQFYYPGTNIIKYWN